MICGFGKSEYFSRQGWTLIFLDVHLICPSCQSVATVFVDRTPKSKAESPRLVPHEGRIAIVTDAGRDAVDARDASDEGADLRTAKSCGPDASTLASSLRIQFAGDGDKRARSPGRARRKPLKPLRAGMPGVSAYPW